MRVGVVLSPMTRARRAARTELFWSVPRAERLRLCAELVNGAGSAIVFCRSASDALRVSTGLSLLGVPAACLEQRDFTSGRVRARLVTDETASACAGEGARCVIQFDPADSPRRYRRRNDLVAGPGAVIVSMVVPEREAQARALLHTLDLPEVLAVPDVATVSAVLARPAAVPPGDRVPSSPIAALTSRARSVARGVDGLCATGGQWVRASWRSRRRPG